MAQQPMRFRRQDDCGALRKDGGSGRMARLHLITTCPLGELHLGEDGKKITRMSTPCHAMICRALPHWRTVPRHFVSPLSRVRACQALLEKSLHLFTCMRQLTHAQRIRGEDFCIFPFTAHPPCAPSPFRPLLHPESAEIGCVAVE